MRPLITVMCALLPAALTAQSAPETQLQQDRQAAWFKQDRAYSTTVPGAVDDPSSGLQWQQHAPDHQLSWASAQDYCAQLQLADSSNWRLPSRLELLSLLNYDKPDSAYDSPLFAGEATVAFWSGTVYDNMPSHVWIAQFGEGDMYCLMRVAQAHVRCVR